MMLLAMLYQFQGQNIQAEPLLVKFLTSVKERVVKSMLDNLINDLAMFFLNEVYANYLIMNNR